MSGWVAALPDGPASETIATFLQVSCERNSQARQQVLEQSSSRSTK